MATSSDLARAIARVVEGGPDGWAVNLWDRLEAFLQEQFGDEAEPKLRALQAYHAKAGGVVPPDVDLMVKSLQQELGVLPKPKMYLKKLEVTATEDVEVVREFIQRGRAAQAAVDEVLNQEKPVAVKKPKAKARSPFQAARAEGKTSRSSKKPVRQSATVKNAKKAPRKPKPTGKPPRPIYDQLAAGSVVQMGRKELIPWPGLNPRQRFDQAELEELAESIKQEGVKVPLVVVLQPKAPHYIAYGERRWRAAGLVGVEQLPVIIATLEESAAFREAVIENVQRKELSAVEEARAIKRLQEDDPKLTQVKVAKLFGHSSQSWASNRLRLLELPDQVLELADDGIVSATALRDSFLVFGSLTDEEVRTKLWKKAGKTVAEAAKEATTLPLADEAVEKHVAAAAVAMSKPLVAQPGQWGGGASEAVYVTIHDHKEGCDCGGPRFQYISFHGAAPRCFNVGWWADQQAEGKKAFTAAAAQQRKSLESEGGHRAAPSGPRNDWRRFTGSQAEPVKKIPAYAVQLTTGGQGLKRVDPAKLAPEHLYQDGAGDVFYIGPTEALEEAEQGWEDALKQLQQAHRRERTQLELAAIGRERVTAEDLRTILAASESTPDADPLEDHLIREAFEDLGFAMPPGRYGDAATTLRKQLEGLEGEDVVRGALLIAHRIRGGALGYKEAGGEEEAAEHELEAQLEKSYLAALIGALPFTLVNQETGANGSELEGTEEAGVEEVDEPAAALSGAETP